MLRTPPTERFFGEGPYHTRSSLRDLEVLGRWRETVAEGIYDIEGWRDGAHRRDDAGQRDGWPRPPTGLADDTRAVRDVALRRLSELDDTAIVKVTEVVMAWHERHSAATLPRPDELERLANLAMKCVGRIEREILESGVDYPIKDVVDTPASVRRRRPQVTAKTANLGAIAVLKRDPTITARRLAEELGCSLGTVAKTPAWKAVQEARKAGRTPRERPTDPKALDELVADHYADPDSEARLPARSSRPRRRPG